MSFLTHRNYEMINMCYVKSLNFLLCSNIKLSWVLGSER